MSVLNSPDLTISDEQNNADYIKEIAEKIKDDHSSVVAFIGAGTSIALGIGNWSYLLSKINYENKINKIKTFVKAEKDIDERLKNHNGNYPKIAKEISKNINDHDFYELVRKYSQETQASSNAIHIHILRLFRTIITTNYDNAFENCASTLSDRHVIYQINQQIIPDVNPARLFLDKNFDTQQEGKIIRNIIHVHGSKELFADKPNLLLLREQDYKKYYPSYYKGKEKYNVSPIQDFMKSILKNFTVVYIGFSFSDDHYYKLIKKLQLDIDEERKRFNSAELSPKNYAILSLKKANEKIVLKPQDKKTSKSYNKKDKSLREKLSLQNINTIVYEDGNHTQIEEILKKIINLSQMTIKKGDASEDESALENS